jgi:hypothetical protein
LAAAFAKGFKGFDEQLAFRAALKDATTFVFYLIHHSLLFLTLPRPPENDNNTL